MNKTEGEDTPCGELVINARRGEQPEVADLPTDDARAVGLEPEVQFLAQTAFQLSHNL